MCADGRATRRQFIKGMALSAAGFSIVPRHVLGGPGFLAPSEVITRGVIGCGGISGGHIGSNRAGKPPEVLAICDVDKNHLAHRLKQAGPPCKTYADWRRLLEHKDIDVIHICTPPHWHALMSIAACQAGFDVWCEKPMTRTIGEGVRVMETVKRFGRVFRINTWFRWSSYYGFGHATQIKKLVSSGLLGWPLKARVSRAAGFNWKVAMWTGKTNATPQPVPDVLDYDMWLGPAPRKPYHPHRVHGSFRGYWDYDGGGLADMGQHYLDPVQYFLDKDETSPVEIEAYAPWPAHPDATGMWGRVDLKYEDGCHLILESGEWGESEASGKPFIEGPKGRLYKGFRTDPPDLVEKMKEYPEPKPMITDFHQSVRTRKPFALNERNAFRSCSLVNLANVAIRTGRKLRYDPEKLEFINDDGANRFVTQPMRAPWHL